jgi:hypothetical protein
LPLRLFWSPPGRVFDLDDPFMLRPMYQVVLRKATLAEELTAYLNCGRLLAVWRDLCLPKGMRRAWEEVHPVLRSVARNVTQGGFPAGGVFSRVARSARAVPDGAGRQLAGHQVVHRHVPYNASVRRPPVTFAPTRTAGRRGPTPD